jgi:hypothetical protein
MRIKKRAALIIGWGLLFVVCALASLAPTPRGAAQRAGVATLPVDKDNDGMADSWEKTYGLSPSNPDDAWQDPDKDNVPNLFEYQLGSHPREESTPAVVTVGSAAGSDYASLADALQSAPAGCVLRVAKGTMALNYESYDPKTVMIQGGWSADFKTRSLKLNPTTLDGGDLNEILYLSYAKAGEYAVILDGLTFTRGNGDFGAVGLLTGGTAFLKTSIVGCAFLKSASNGAAYGGALSVHYWDQSSGDLTLANSLICGNAAGGVYTTLQFDAKARWRLIHSAIYGNKKGTGYESGYGMRVTTCLAKTPSFTARAFNSVIWGNALGDLNLDGDIVFNVDHADLGRVKTLWEVKCVRGEGVVNVNPKFADPARFNYHLKATSPMIDKGLKKGIPLTDFEGDKRVKGAAPDIGPDER